MAGSPHPHRRWNPLRGEWVLVSAHRTQRPWQGQTDSAAVTDRPQHDPGCYLCPRNERASGDVNPDYASSFVFTNDYPALLPGQPEAVSGGPFDRIESVSGTSRVICFSPRHDLTLATMGAAGIRSVVDLWAGQTEELEAEYQWVQVFENRGEVMGASNPHPHGQIWAGSSIPSIPRAELTAQQTWFSDTGRPLLLDYLAHERQQAERIVVTVGGWSALVPFWAVWPFEVMVLPDAPTSRLPGLDAQQRDDLAGVLDALLRAYDRLFETPFPYSMGWHGSPADGQPHPEWVVHAHFYPPLLRSATVRKFLVGYEMLSEPQRDLTAEEAAARLRAVAD